MSNLTSILGTDYISSSYGTINTNFNQLNQNKAESSVLTSLLSGKIQMASVAASIYSLTTAATDQVNVWARGTVRANATAASVALIYNGVIKDQLEVKIGATAETTPYSLFYSEIPGAGTHNVVTSVIANGSLVIENPKMLIQIIP